MAAQAQACIDEEIAKQILSLCNLRTRRNSFSLISRLPTETLATIFIHCAHDYHREDRGYVIRTVPSWVNVSYVCRHWRNVALNCPTFWTYIFVTSQRWTEELLARSKQASLKLRYREQTLRGLYLVEQVINQMERIQDLCLDLPDQHTHEDYHEVLSTISSRASRLQNLKISVWYRPSEYSFVLFDGNTPALRTLELMRCPVRLNLLKLSGLTTLSLYCIPDRFQQSVVEFLAMLSCMPDLTRLYLEDALASAIGFLSSSAFNTSQKINSPRLSRLLIDAPLSTVIALLSCVNIPLKTEVRLQCNDEHDSSPVEYALLCSALAQRFSMTEDQALSSPTIRSLFIEFDQWGKVKLAFSECDCDSFGSLSCRDWGSNIPLKMIVDLGLITMAIDGDIISDICCSIPLTNVQTLHVVEPLFSPAFWRKTLGHLQDLRYIELSDGNMPDLASVLSVTDLTAHEGMENQGGPAPSDRDQCRILVPRLETLELRWMTFSPGGDSDMQDPAITRRCLLDALSTRNAPQGRLLMTRCYIDSSTLLDVVRSWDEPVVDETDEDFVEGSVSDHD